MKLDFQKLDELFMKRLELLRGRHVKDRLLRGFAASVHSSGEFGLSKGASGGESTREVLTEPPLPVSWGEASSARVVTA